MLSNGRVTVPDTKNRWVEVKSIKGNYKGYLDYWNVWNMTRSQYGGHRQFFLDRAAITKNTLPGVNPSDFPQAEDFEWWFQQFKRKPRGKESIRSVNDSELSKIRENLRLLPKGDASGAHYISLGSSTKKGADKKITFVNQRVQHFNLKNWLLREGRNLISDVSDDLVDELVAQSPEF